MFETFKKLGWDDVEGLENFKDEYRSPAEDEDSYHHDKHCNNLLRTITTEVNQKPSNLLGLILLLISARFDQEIRLP